MSDISLEMVIHELGAEMTNEEMVDQSVDGGIWNLYCQKYVDKNGAEYTFECGGDDASGFRVGHQCVDVKKKSKGCGALLFYDDDEWVCGAVKASHSTEFCKTCDPVNGIDYFPSPDERDAMDNQQ